MFSVVVPVYNHREFIVAGLLSAVQSPLVTEVLVVDDGSVDRSKAVIAALASVQPKIEVVQGASSGNLGAHVRLNELVRQARNPWIAVLNSDDEFVPGRFEAIERCVQRREADLFFGDLVIIDQTGERVGLRRAIADNEYPWNNLGDAIEAAERERWTELLVQQNIIATTTNMVFTKDIFERVGGFRAFRYCHDWDFALRVSLVGRLKYKPLLLSRYRIHPGNTIREKRIGVEAEVRTMMADLRAEYAIEHDTALSAALLRNRYLYPARTPWLDIVRSGDRAYGVMEAAVALSDIDVKFVETPTKGEYVYAPRAGITELTRNDLRNIRLAIAVRRYDIYLISRTLNPFPDVGTASVQDLILYRRGWKPTNRQSSRARLIRLMPGSRTPAPLASVIGALDITIDHAFGESADDDNSWPNPLPLPDEGLGERQNKPVVFILPIFLAMGGAERLVIETTRHLAKKYHFVIVNTEPLRPEHGSLHGEALNFAEVYDISETVRREDRLGAIELLKRSYQPAVVWITNGSPWQIANAAQLRRIFSDTPIVDNQSYDHEQGWISALSEPAVRSADRYIAINSKIRTVMIERYGVADTDIDLVLHGAKISHLAGDLPKSEDRPAIRASLGLPADRLVFGMVGRLTSQKRPKDLVHLANRVASKGGNAHFLWAGPGELREELDVLCRQMSVNNFSLLAPRNDVRPIYQSLDGLIVTSEFEGLPFVVLEALAMGVPVLSTPVGAIEEVLSRFGCGRISGKPGDLDALELAFQKFVEELPVLRAAVCRRRQEIIAAFSGERMAAEYDASWTRAIAAKQRRFPAPAS
jgi:glycosyltransferase involved in cell wall biosynthesis